MLWTPQNEFHWRLSSFTGQPASAVGTSITPGNNTKGSYTEVISDTVVVNDVYGIRINFNSNSVSTVARDTIVDIGTDPAGGTSYGVVIPDLLASCAQIYLPAATGAAGGIWYYFPLFIPAGSAIAARASVNNATVGTLSCWIQLFGRPTRPDLVKVGSRVTAYGIVAASSRGTTITPGTVSEGAYVSLGTPSVDNWWWQVGMGVNDGSMSDNVNHLDLAYGDATNKHLILEDVPWMSDGGEGTQSYMYEGDECCRHIPASQELWGRAQCSATPDSAISMAAYGLGG
jgi:hypothetical protein